MANRKHNEETRLKIGASLAETARRRVNEGSMVLALWGKPLGELDIAERARWRRLSQATSYFRRHERNKEQQRRDKSWDKLEILDVLGWPAACSKCGYDNYIGALDFHHLDPATKSGKVTTVEEARKCVLLCANCHREAERDMRAAGKASTVKGGRPKTIADPWLERYMRLSGLSEATITKALSGRPVFAAGGSVLGVSGQESGHMPGYSCEDLAQDRLCGLPAIDRAAIGQFDGAERLEVGLVSEAADEPDSGEGVVSHQVLDEDVVGRHDRSTRSTAMPVRWAVR